MSNANSPTSSRLASTSITGELEMSGTQKLQEKACELKQNLHDLGDAAREAAQEQMGQLRDTATGYIKRKCAKCEEVEQSYENKIQTQPLKSTLIACGVGFVLGWFFRRR